jgi:hypothetical protein
MLENVVYHETEHPFLTDFLVDKYGFTEVEDDTQKVAKEQKPVSESSENEKDDTTVKVEVTKYSCHKKLAGDYLDAEIQIQIQGDIALTHTILQISPEEQQSTYSTVYQTVRISSVSGYAIQKLLERVVVDLGLIAGKQDWSFHRG